MIAFNTIHFRSDNTHFMQKETDFIKPANSDLPIKSGLFETRVQIIVLKIPSIAKTFRGRMPKICNFMSA